MSKKIHRSLSSLTSPEIKKSEKSKRQSDISNIFPPFQKAKDKNIDPIMLESKIISFHLNKMNKKINSLKTITRSYPILLDTYFKPFIMSTINKINLTLQDSQTECNIECSDDIDSKENVYIPNSSEFNKDDFKLLKEIISNEKKILEVEIQQITANQTVKIETDFKEKFANKWNKLRSTLKTLTKISLLNNDIKTFGTSLNMNEISSLNRLENFEKPAKLKKKKIKVPVFHPETSVFLKYWLFLLMFLTFYTVIITPYRLTVLDEEKSDITEILIDILFGIDVIITLNSGYFDSHKKYVTNRIRIAFYYLKTWLIIDIVCLFPFDLLMRDNIDNNIDIENNTATLIKALSLSKLYRLIKVIRMVKIISKLKALGLVSTIQVFLRIQNYQFKLGLFFLMSFICVHIMGCFWLFSAKIHNFGPQTWVFHSNMDTGDSFQLYIAAIYWAMSTLCTVGYGDIHAENDIEIFLSLFWMFLGVGFYSYMLGSLSNLVANSDSRKGILRKKIILMESFCDENHLSKDLKKRLKRALEYNSSKGILSNKEKNELLREIPGDLLFEMANSMFSGFITKFIFFRDKDDIFIAHFVPHLSPMKVLKGEIVFKKDEFPYFCYFLLNGRASYLYGTNNLCIKFLVPGAFFGDFEIFNVCNRLFSVMAIEDLDLLYISKSVKFILFCF